MFDFVLKGGNASQLEKDIGSDMFPANEHFFGLVNVSSTNQIRLDSPKTAAILDPSPVRQHLLLQLGAAGPLLLQALPREGAGVQGEEQAEQGDAAHVPRRPLLLDRHAEEEGRHHRAQEVHRQAQKGER